MRAFLATYSYLVGSVAACLILVVPLALYRSQRATMLWSGVLAIPWAVGSLVLETAYWHPQRIAGSFVGPEDAMCSFSAGVVAWLIATSFLRPRLPARPSWTRIFRHLSGGSLIGGSLYAAQRCLGVPLMASIASSMLAVAVLLVFRAPRFWTLPLLGGMAFPAVYLGLAAAFFAVRPDALGQWNLANLSGILLFGVPIEELQWAVGFGTMWPLLMAHALDVRADSGSVA